jgi:hypothetical protein
LATPKIQIICLLQIVTYAILRGIFIFCVGAFLGAAVLVAAAFGFASFTSFISSAAS